MVRSFGPAAREAISFNTPLTLIVGYNGSGKTTIIECLKYATTGELPPNSKGGAFIHDPKLCGEKEVLAQVKLAFRSTGGARFVVTRSLQLTVKKASRSQKTLEGSLVWNSNGERSTVSSKVADLDEVVPRELGVSQAILDAVIFCHQDESLWPMSEPSVLKKRFDAIFEAMRYTKAIDNIKILRKKQGEKLSTMKILEEQDRITKEKAERARKRSTDLQTEIEQLREKCNSVSGEMEEAHAASLVKHKEANSFLRIVQDLGNKREQLGYREDAIKEIKMSIEEMEESDEWLADALTQYEKKVGQHQALVAEKKAAYNDLQGELSSSRKSLQGKLSEQGKHQSDKDKYERQVQSRVDLVRDAARMHAIRGFDGDINDAQVKTFTNRLMKLLSDKKRELESTQKTNGEELDRATAIITDLEGKRASRTQDRVTAKNRMGAIEKRSNVLLSQISSLNVDESARTILKSQCEEVDQRLSLESKKAEDSKWDKHIQEESSSLSQLETENSKLGSELVECTRMASDRAQLDLRKKEQTDRQRKLDTLTTTWKDKLTSILDGPLDPDTLDRKFSAILSNHDRVLEDARRTRDGFNREYEQLEFRLTTAREDRMKKSAEGATAKTKVIDALKKADVDVLDIDKYEEEVGVLEKDILSLEKDIFAFEAVSKYYGDCSEALESQDKCKLCERSFKDAPGSKSKLRKKIQKQLTPGEKQQLEADLEDTRPILESLKAVQQSYEMYRATAVDLPTICAVVKTIEAQREATLRKVEYHDQVVKDVEDEQRDLEAMNKTVINISQLARDISEGQSQISRLESQQISFAGTRSADEIHDLQTAVGDQIRTVKQKIAKLTAEKQRSRDVISSLELEKSELTNKMHAAERQLERKQDIQGQIQGLKDDSNHQRETIQKADQELEALEPQITSARSIREDALATGRAKEHAIVDERDRFANSASELKMMDADISDYINRGAAAAMTSNQRAIKSLESSLERIEKDVAEVTRESNQLREEIANSDRYKKNISDNLSYRKQIGMLERLRTDIAHLESRNATDDYNRLIRNAQRLETHYSKLLAERASIMGSMKTKDEEFGRLIDEYNLDYKDADEKYRESHIKVETTKAAIEDLGKLGDAVDKAIMHYHTLKMEEVNRIAGELWQSTYQGTDIDTILIRSDNESATGKRSYNYRVCMVKQDTEMDMRGRCSAGQKVLASIIIRLALAESFGVNCGLIALDEPTTNLDRDNIRALATSLHTIIKARQQQSNFQLIVITHDEEFLRHMKCADFCDTFFSVSRNDRQNSLIAMESISKVSES